MAPYRLIFLLGFRVNNPAIFSVSQLNQRARQLLEVSFANVRVEGEISGLSRPASGHWYFTLKDANAQVRCAMFRSRAAAVRFMPKEGDRVELRAKVSLYENRGDYQLIVDAMKPAGEGALLLAFQQLKERLNQAGLFDERNKKPIPRVRRVGIITSPTGAAVHDIITVLKRRNPAIEVDLYPTAVQGREATAQIVAAIERANRDQRVDALIVGRGGGSLEDLWCFNEEPVAWAIFHSALPVISAVGHEVDFTIADFVADMRAPTPSAAAELVSQDQSVMRDTLAQYEQRLLYALRRGHQQRQMRLHALTQRVRGPERQVQYLAQHLDQLEMRMRAGWSASTRQRNQRLAHLQQALSHQHPQKRLADQGKALELIRHQLVSAINNRLHADQISLAGQAKLLNSLSPLNVLVRGYSITQKDDGSVVHSTQDVQADEELITRVSDGWVRSTVTLCGNDKEA